MIAVSSTSDAELCRRRRSQSGLQRNFFTLGIVLDHKL
jgi:hypothetical protein